jgi:DNA-binding NarL/FixJ family response regulator
LVQALFFCIKNSIFLETNQLSCDKSRHMNPVSKQRPSGRIELAPAFSGSASDSTVSEWLPRIFRNSYTRDGQRFLLDGWSVKIQHQGQRHTFSLGTKTKLAAAAEAKAIYETLLRDGWDAVRPAREAEPKADPGVPKASASWKDRLLIRRYGFPATGENQNHLSAHLEFTGRDHWFPLGTSDLELAQIKAQEISDFLMRQGWNATCARFSRELIVGFQWCSNPILWTYTTLHTLTAPAKVIESSGGPEGRRILVLESDPGIRRALQWCIDQQPGFCSAPCDSPESFARAFAAQKPQMVLVNSHLAQSIGFNSPGRIAAIKPGVPAVTYSVVTSGDQLFVSTPAGAEGYLLKRVDPAKILEPILSRPGLPELVSGDLLPRVKSFFKELLLPRYDPETSRLARLTPREHEVLALLSKGCVDKEIAQAMSISAWTVHGHIKNIFERLQVRTRTEAVVRYLEK